MKRILIVVVAATCLSSCEEEKVLPDPHGTIELNIGDIQEQFMIRDTDRMGERYWLHHTYSVSWTPPSNIQVKREAKGCYPEWCYTDEPWMGFGTFDIDAICSVGKVAGLGNITKIPDSGYASKVSCSAGFGYVICYDDGSDDANSKTYARMYIVEEITDPSGVITGAKVKYQYPF